MRPATLSYTPSDDDTDGFANDVNTTSGLSFTLAATSVGDSMAHKVIITPSGSVTGNYSLTGTDENGRAQTETLATDTVNAVTSAKFYLTLTEVLAPSGIGANTVDIGWTDDVVSPAYPLDWPSGANANIFIDISGTIDFTVQESFSNIFTTTVPVWSAISALTSKTADTFGQANPGATAFRILVNSLTAGATIAFTTSQPDRVE